MTDVIVTQEDREAAWPLAPDCYCEADKHAWLAGRYDSIPTIQAFASHRIKAALAMQESIVAWLQAIDLPDLRANAIDFAFCIERGDHLPIRNLEPPK